MTRFHQTTLCGLLWLALSAAASATTLTIAYQNFNVDNGGGGFQAYLNGNSSQIFEAFCVDYRNTVAPPDTYNVNVDTLSVSISDARYGTTAQAQFSYQNAPDAISFGNASNRYLLAGWLTTQYDLNNPGGAMDAGIQSAIWNILDTNGVNHTGGDVSTWENNAVVWESLQTSAELLAFAGEVRIYTSMDVAGNSDLNNSDQPNRYSIGKQEVLSVVPEPGVMMLVGVGLTLLGLVRRRPARIG